MDKENETISEVYNDMGEDRTPEAHAQDPTSTGFVGSISPREGIHKIMLTDSGHIVLVYPQHGHQTYIGHIHSHPDGEHIKSIRINPEDIGE